MTAFQFTLRRNDQVDACVRRHLGARRFAFNQCLAGVKDALDKKRADPSVEVPWQRLRASSTTSTPGKRPSKREGASPSIQVARPSLSTSGFPGETRSAPGVRGGGDRPRPRPRTPLPSRKRETGKGRVSGSLATKRSDPRPTRSGSATEGLRARAAPRSGSEPKEAPASVTLPVIGTVEVIQDTREGCGASCDQTPTEAHGRAFADATVKGRPRPSHPHPHSRRSRVPPCYAPRPRNPRPARTTSPESIAGSARLRRRRQGRRARGRPSPTHQGDGAGASRSSRTMSRRVARKQAGSANEKRAKEKLRRLHGAIADQRRHYLHNCSTQLVKTHDELSFRDVVGGEHGEEPLPLSVDCRRFLGGASARITAYKAAWYGTDIVFAPRFYPSTKTCSSCGWVSHDIGRSDRVFSCRQCGAVIDP